MARTTDPPCYWGAETCRKAHTPDCPMSEGWMHRARVEEFFGPARVSIYPPSGDEDTLPISQGSAPVAGGFIQGGAVMAYDHRTGKWR